MKFGLVNNEGSGAIIRDHCFKGSKGKYGGWKEGNIVTFKLEFIHDKTYGYFRCLVNDEETARYSNVARSNHIKYKLAIELYNKNDSVSLLSYQQLYDDESDSDSD